MMDPGDEDDGGRPRVIRPPLFVEWFPMVFRQLANGYATRYGAPLFLVGSALREAKPHDVDIRIPLQDHDIERLFGTDTDRPEIGDTPVQMQRWMHEELKQSRRLARMWRENFDLQFQPFERFWRSDAPRIRLDTIPKWTFLAGMTNA